MQSDKTQSYTAHDVNIIFNIGVRISMKKSHEETCKSEKKVPLGASLSSVHELSFVEFLVYYYGHRSDSEREQCIRERTKSLSLVSEAKPLSEIKPKKTAADYLKDSELVPKQAAFDYFKDSVNSLSEDLSAECMTNSPKIKPTQDCFWASRGILIYVDIIRKINDDECLDDILSSLPEPLRGNSKLLTAIKTLHSWANNPDVLDGTRLANYCEFKKKHYAWLRHTVRKYLDISLEGGVLSFTDFASRDEQDIKKQESYRASLESFKQWPTFFSRKEHQSTVVTKNEGNERKSHNQSIKHVVKPSTIK